MTTTTETRTTPADERRPVRRGAVLLPAKPEAAPAKAAQTAEPRRFPITDPLPAGFKLDPNAIVRVLRPNPCLPGKKNYDRWTAGYKDGRTVAQTIAAGMTAGDVRCALERGFAKLDAPAAKVDEAKAPKID